ncbi:MAG: hypothetical protein MJA27_11095, partial [Pseudanabaenales cyanobacterium]|nr:hypothetical protein [Pseudanabaenales cyanobacterium]
MRILFLNRISNRFFQRKYVSSQGTGFRICPENLLWQCFTHYPINSKNKVDRHKELRYISKAPEARALESELAESDQEPRKQNSLRASVKEL